MRGKYVQLKWCWQTRFNYFDFKRDDAGTSAVEFAIILPVFLVILLGILSFGLYFGAAHSTAQLAADAARASVAGLSDTERTSIATKLVANTASNYPLLTFSKVTVAAAPSVEIPPSSRSTSPLTPQICRSGCSLISCHYHPRKFIGPQSSAAAAFNPGALT